MEKYKVNFKDELPKYIQLYYHIKKSIDLGEIKDGERLPSIRELCKTLNVNKVTVINSFKKLKDEGYVRQVMGSGTYAKKKDILLSFKKEYSQTFKKLVSGEFKEFIDFTGETTSSHFFPVNDLKKVLNKVLDRDGADALLYQDVLGYKELRKEISLKFWNNKIDYNDILIVSGAQQGIDIASKALLNVNDNVIIEKPTYGGALSVFKNRRANIFEVPIENDGINLIKFEKILKKTKVKLFYAMSYFQNPTGISYSHEKKKKILELSNKYGFYIVEDDYLSELIYSKKIKYKTFKELDCYDRVIYIKSFSKIFLPGIRIGYLISPKKFGESFGNYKINTDISTSSLMQRALELYIKEDMWKKHIEFLNIEYKKRYEFMKNEIGDKMLEYVDFIDPLGGLNFFMYIRDNISINSKELFYKLREEKILLTPGIMFFKNPKCGEKSFRIGFSQTNEEQISYGISKICDILKRYRKDNN